MHVHASAPDVNGGPEPTPEFVVSARAPSRLPAWATLAVVAIGATVGVLVFDAPALAPLALAGLALGTLDGRWRSALLVPVAIAARALVLAELTVVDGMETATSTPRIGLAVVLLMLTLGAATVNQRRGLWLALGSVILLAATTTADVLVPGAPVDLGIDLGTALALVAVADRLAARELHRPGEPGAWSRAAAATLTLAPSAALHLLTWLWPSADDAAAAMVVWGSVWLLSLGIAWWGGTRLRTRTADLAAVTAMFVESEDRGVVTVSADGTVLAANVTAETILGGPGVTIVGVCVDGFMAPIAGKRHAQDRERFGGAQGTRPMRASGPVRATALDGREVLLRIALRRVSGGEERTMVVIEDLTAEQAEADALRDQLAQQETMVTRLHQLEALRTGLLTAASHELRTPVTVIHGTAELLAGRLGQLDGDTAQALLDRQLNQSRRLVALLDDLIAMDPDGSITTHPRAVDLNRTLRAVVERWSRRNGGFPVTLLGHRTIGWIDPAVLERILTTLLDNARIHGAPPVAIQLLPQDGSAVVRVSDSGRGIPPHLSDEIFQPFGRGASVDAANPGLGLGLPLARILAEADGGTLLVGEAQYGTTMRLQIPTPPVGAHPPQATVSGASSLLVVRDESVADA